MNKSGNINIKTLRKKFDKRVKSFKLDEPAKGELFERFFELYNHGFKCAYCGVEMELKWGDTELAFTIDHVVPRACAGTDYIDNLTFCCQSCNSMKSDKSVGWFLNNIKKLKERKQRNEAYKARKSAKKDKQIKEAYKEIFGMVNAKGETK